MAPSSAGRGEVDARYDGHEQHGEASFNTDDAEHRIDWSPPSGYHGWMKVDRSTRTAWSRSRASTSASSPRTDG